MSAGQRQEPTSPEETIVGFIKARNDFISAQSRLKVHRASLEQAIRQSVGCRVNVVGFCTRVGFVQGSEGPTAKGDTRRTVTYVPTTSLLGSDAPKEPQVYKDTTILGVSDFPFEALKIGSGIDATTHRLISFDHIVSIDFVTEPMGSEHSV